MSSLYIILSLLLLFISPNGFSPATCATCGLSQPCTDGSCCSQYGFCGNTTGFCSNGCLSMCQASNSSSPSPAASANTVDTMVSSALTSDVFDQFFYDHSQAGCPTPGFYNLSSFLSAAATFPSFGTTGGSIISKRELAAFFAYASFVTTGGCYVEAVNTSLVGCFETSVWGCASGKKYYGRGPLQISWNTNYGPIGKALGFDGINDPDLVATNPILSFRASLWFWMTVQPNQIYSCHQAILLPSQGLTKVVSILQGGSIDSDFLEGLTKVYETFCSILGVQPYDMTIAPAPFSTNMTQAAPELLQHKSCIGSLCTIRSKVLGFGLPLALGGCATLVLALSFFNCQRRKWHDEEIPDCKSIDLEKIQGLAETPTHFHYATLETATEGFTAMLGKGGFGVVYKGVLPSGEAIAVKVLNDSRHTEEQFLKEIEALGKLHHVNVVRLMGFCIEKSKRILVYEYISNNSLDKHLFNKSEGKDEGSPVLSWEKRYEVALGIARGLSYIHEECRHKIIHRDMKPQNILLDELFCPKIADFGLAKIIKREENRVVSQMRGTPGYVAPEFWAELRGPLSTMFDVFSYGMVMLELVAGRPNVKEDAPSEELFLSEWAFSQVAFPAIIIDRRIAHLANLVQVKILVLVALWCIQEDPAQRPSMSRVVQYLEGSIDVPANPPPHSKRVMKTLSSTVSRVSSGQLSYVQGR